MITWADVVAFAAELSDVALAAQTDILAYVNQALVENDFGGSESPFLRLARIYLAAHYGAITLQGSNGPAGPVTSESVGGISRAYALFSPLGSDPLMDTTPYGRAFRSLLRRSPARAPVVL